MKQFILVFSVLIVFLGTSWADESNLSISDIAVTPSTVRGGGTVLISCRVSHVDGPVSIKRVAAVVNYDGWVASYPDLFDDGTNGDEVAEDGVYSLRITVMERPGEASIVFTAVDTDNRELDSEKIALIVQ
jgi:hypothetical protein